MFVEQLETRQLLSASGVSLENGVLTLQGTSKADCLAVGQKDTKLIVNNNGCFSWVWASDVKKIVICGGAGADEIIVYPAVCKNTALFGENGKDRIIGGSGDDYIDGGNGKDCLFGGMTGRDVIIGENGVDEITGGKGSQKLYGGRGADCLFGGYDGGAKDYINSGPGADTILH